MTPTEIRHAHLFCGLGGGAAGFSAGAADVHGNLGRRNSGAPSVLIAYGPLARRALEQCRLDGWKVDPNA